MTATNQARLDGPRSSVVLELTDKCVLWRYLGAPHEAPPPGDAARWRPRATFSLDDDASLPLMPTHGLGWFGPAALELRRSDGTAPVVHFAECSFLPGEGALVVRMTDPAIGIACEVAFRVVAGGALQIVTAVENRGAETLLLERLASAILPLQGLMRELRSWRGVHAMELSECREPMPKHAWIRETRRGIPGHGGPPGIYALAEGATRHGGLAFALQLAWSGDSRIAVEHSDEGGWVATAEARHQPGEIVLAPGARHEAPPVLLAISTEGTNGAMMQHHAAVREILRWPGGSMAPRPVHLNTWEACYFDQDEPRLFALAEGAARLGVERFVLDDGWFLGRRDDRRALGDWIPDPTIYPGGLAPLARKVESLGMQFGLWVEPEMISPDSELYRAHPEWALAPPAHLRPPTGRHQLVLDMRRPEVRDHLFAALDRLLRDAPVRYLKWDHNRDLAPAGGAAQVRGTYELLARLREANPEVEIESCAGGGGRCDAGIAAFTHRFWTSDNLDAVSRVAIQRGFLAFFPPEVMGAHVGASPAHATGRRQSLDFRAAVACMGHFGLELDPASLSSEDRTELAGWIAFHKQWRDLIHGGQVSIGEGEDGLVWQAHQNGDQALLFAIRMAPSQLRRPLAIPLPFAREAAWTVSLQRLAGANRWLGAKPWKPGESGSALFDGDWLSSAGLPLPPMAGESVAIFSLQRVASSG